MVDFANMVLAIIGVISVVVGAATTYLRLYVGQRLAELELTLPNQFVSHKVFEDQIKNLDERIAILEVGRVDP